MTIRTTGDGAGRAVGVVMGLGTTPDQAVMALATDAEQKVADVMQSAPQSGRTGGLSTQTEEFRRKVEGLGLLPSGFETPIERWLSQFEVVDARLTPGPVQHGDTGWLAYGTLTWKGKPEQASIGST